MTRSAPTAAELSSAAWFTSSFTNAGNECVEIAHVRTWTAVRDSKDPGGAVLLIARHDFGRFVAHVRDGCFRA